MIHAHLRVIVHIDGQARQLAGGIQSLPLLVGAEQSCLQVTGIDIGRPGTEPAITQSLALHLEAVHQYVLSGATCHKRQVQSKSSLAHRGASGDDVQVARLQPCRHHVQIVQAGGNTGDAVPVVCHTGIHLLQSVEHQLIHVAQMVIEGGFTFQMIHQAVQQRQGVVKVHRLVGSGDKQLVQPTYHLPAQIHSAQDAGMLLQVSR